MLLDACAQFGMTALMFAALFGKTSAMTQLAKLKAQQRAVNRDGMNLLHLAAIAGRDDSIKHILTNFTRVNALQNDLVCALCSSLFSLSSRLEFNLARDIICNDFVLTFTNYFSASVCYQCSESCMQISAI